ncbi:F-box/kelch-repeat protein At3g06240-like [Lotus japonicus]|uniref:F-box/kelch-repeat protein At3g06240-like n=1 Tax=Lotus japonicus TaxID=34305 RepID=UPI002584151E|nr:F-box/kelch-repeat protein At3g06240-like [Lotus japonicus]
MAAPLAVSDEVVFSILSKLPLKSLKRFICIHKSFSLLLEDSYFMTTFRTNFISKLHSYYHHTSLLLLQADANSSAMYLLSGESFQNRLKLHWPPPFQEDSRYVEILNSGIHGTLCLHRNRGYRGDIVLWNPSTEEFKIIPPSPIESLPYMDILLRLHGFSYDHVTDDYKVIREVSFFQYLTDFEGDWDDVPKCPDPYPDPLWEIYSLRSNSWRKLDIEMHSAYRDDSIYMNGVCHWLCRPNQDIDEGHLLSFNFSHESSFTTALPLDLCDIMIINRPVVLNGSIAVISNHCETTTFHITVLGEVGVKESWMKLFTVGPLPCVEYPIGMGKKGDIFFTKKDEEVVWFDLGTMMVQEIGLKGKSPCTRMVIYKENLLRLSK